MGSTIFHPGIHGPIAPMVDANFANDPEAAHIVLQSGANVIVAGSAVFNARAPIAENLARLRAAALAE